MKICHIFSGGELKNLDFIRINDDDMVICADSGLKYALMLNLIPDIIVGDFDSYTAELPENVRILSSPPEKDDTDTMLAVRTAIENGAVDLKIYGALGGRFDHAIANLQTLKYVADHGCKAVLEDSENLIMLQECGECRYSKIKGWYFSVFAYSEQLHIRRLAGVKYPLENTVLTNSFPLGVSNEFIESEAVLEIDKGTAIVICSKM